MKAEIDESSGVAQDTSMGPPTSHQAKMANKRRQSRFDPMGDEPDEEGYGEPGHRLPFRKTDEKESRNSFSLPGIRSLLNPTNERDGSSSAATPPYHQSPSLPSLVSTSPSGSPSTLRTSRYSSLTSGSSMSADSHGWWAPDFDRTPSQASGPRSRFPAPLYIDENDPKRRRSDQPSSVRDHEEQARLRWMAQSRNASVPTTATAEPVSTASSPGLRSMQPPAPPSASMSRHSRSQQEPPHPERRPSAVPRSLSLVSGPLTSSFAELTASERERERQGSMSHPHGADMPPPFPSPMRLEQDRRFSPGLSQSNADIHRMRANTDTPPERFRGYSQPPEADLARPAPQRAGRSSLSEMIMAQSGDAQAMSTGRYINDMSGSAGKHSAADINMGGWQPTRRSSNSSTQSTSTPGVTVHLNSDDGHTPMARYRRDFPEDNDRNNPMGGMDVLAESARRVSEEEEIRRSNGMGMDEREDSPRAGGPGGPKYQCAYCSKTFSRPSSLRIHTYSHTGERPFVCQEPSCGRRFSVQSNLKRHAKVHQLGQSGGASLHQLHAGPIPPRGPGPGNSGPPHHQHHGAHPYYQGPPQGLGGYGYDHRFPPQPYPQPRDGLPYDPRHHGGGKGWNDMEEDELEDDEELDDDRIKVE